MIDAASLESLVAMAAIISKIVSAWSGPIYDKFPNLSSLWKLYISMVLGAVAGWFTGLNAFPVFPNPSIGRVVSAAVCIVTPSILYDSAKLVQTRLMAGSIGLNKDAA